jgi:hypothetical protein
MDALLLHKLMEEIVYGCYAPGSTKERHFGRRFMQHMNAVEEAPEGKKQMRPQQPKPCVVSKGWKKYAADFPKIGKGRSLFAVDQTDDFQTLKIIQPIQMHNQLANNRPDAATSAALARADRNQIERDNRFVLSSHPVLS